MKETGKLLCTGILTALSLILVCSVSFGEMKIKSPGVVTKKGPTWVVKSCASEFTWRAGLTDAFIKRNVDVDGGAETIDRKVHFILKRSAMLGLNIHCYYDSDGPDKLVDFGYYFPCKDAVKSPANPNEFTCSR